MGGAMLAAPLSAAAEASYYSCDLQYDSCMYSAAQESNPIKRNLMEMGCAAEKAACYLRTAAERVGDAIVEAGQWIHDNAGAIIVGTVVVILVISFIVVTNGAGAPVLAFL